MAGKALGLVIFGSLYKKGNEVESHSLYSYMGQRVLCLSRWLGTLRTVLQRLRIGTAWHAENSCPKGTYRYGIPTVGGNISACFMLHCFIVYVS